MASAQDPSPDCPLPRHQQIRNLVLFAACTSLQYLAAPVGYVGLTQASLCRELKASDAVANLPGSVYLALTFSPVIFAWLIPYISWLKRNLVICYGTAAMTYALVAVVLLSRLDNEIKIAVVILQSAILGIFAPSAVAFLWEVIGRGAAESRRGLALALAFGVGPLFAVAGSFGSQLVLESSLRDRGLGIIVFPANFAVLYAAATPIMALAASLSWLFIVVEPETEPVRRPFLETVFGGLWDFLRNRVLLTATVVTILVYTGNTITGNLNLYSQEVYGESPMFRAGYQNTARFAFKMAAGLLLGWLLSRTNPKIGLLATALTFTASLLLAMVASAETYFLVFGIYGAGELVGVYAPNYILSASPKEDIRRNMAFVTMMMAPAAPAGYLFGMISDQFGAIYGKAAGYQISFAVCAAIMLVGIVLAIVMLPARPGGDKVTR